MLRLILRVVPVLALVTLAAGLMATLTGRVLDGPVLAYVSPPDATADLVLLDWRTGVRWRTGTPYADMSPLWSADGERLAFFSAREGDSRYYLLQPGQPVHPFPRIDVSLPDMIFQHEALWTADDAGLLYMQPQGDDTRIYRIEAETNRLQRLDVSSDQAQAFLERLSVRWQGYAYAAGTEARYRLRQSFEDGHWILFRDDLQTGASLRIYDSGSLNRIVDYALSPGGRYAAVSLQRMVAPDILVFDLLTGARHEVASSGMNPAWRP